MVAFSDTKQCYKCKRRKSLSAFNKSSTPRSDGYQSYCRRCQVAGHRAYLFKKKYGITIEHYESLLRKQGGACSVCKKPETATARTGVVRRLNVDHCHDTGKVRGLLCVACNVAIGMACDDPKRLRALADYLESC